MSDTCGCGSNEDLSHATPAYRRALWLVALLNAGYGVVQIGAGFLTHSQALMADALDFLGDGAITWLGLLAINWKLGWRARAALLQGIFLASLGAAVLGATLYRVFALRQPEAGMMSIFAGVGVIVNVTAAMVLIPHRHGDANVRAVWLFSRNDAIAGTAVVIAGAFVAWTQTAWPDLIVAAIIAGLFVHSAWAIIADAREDLRKSSA